MKTDRAAGLLIIGFSPRAYPGFFMNTLVLAATIYCEACSAKCGKNSLLLGWCGS